MTIQNRTRKAILGDIKLAEAKLDKLIKTQEGFITAAERVGEKIDTLKYKIEDLKKEVPPAKPGDWVRITCGDNRVVEGLLLSTNYALAGKPCQGWLNSHVIQHWPEGDAYWIARSSGDISASTKESVKSIEVIEEAS